LEERSDLSTNEAAMYTVISWNQSGKVVRVCGSLGEAYRLIRVLGRGAIFRSGNAMNDKYAMPIYPRKPV
jgi:hypothetical protein